ncbi:MAG TPA: endospore germination permease [Symbiobacteriaceae bacterium]|jgi:spore germination protein KB
MSAPAERISALQGAMLIANTILPTAILFLPATAAAQAKEDAWLSPLVAAAGGMGLAWIHTALALRFPGQSLIQLAVQAAGGVLGKLVGFCYLWWWLHITAVILREFAEFMTIGVAPTTPISVFILVILALCAYAVRHGIEVLARANEPILAAMTVSLLMLVGLVASKMRLDNVMPFLADGLGPVLKGAVAPVSWMGEVVTALMAVFPYLAKPKEARPVAMGGLLFTGVILSVIGFATLAAAGVHATMTARVPTLLIARLIEMGDTAERMEPLFVAIWVSGNFVKISIFYYSLCQGIAQWLGLQDYRPLVLPAFTLVAPLSLMIFEDSAQMSSFLDKTWPPYAIVLFELGFPALLLLLTLMRGTGTKVARNA